jgi:glycosyltransferase involved in cell wall biosynthesis
MKPVHVVYLTYDGLTDPLGQSQILPYVIGLSKRGYEFSIISFEKKEAFAVRKKSIDEICEMSKIEWIPLRYHKTPPVLSTLFDVWVMWKEVKRRNERAKFQIIHCRSYITSLVGLRAKRTWRVKFIFDMRGFWADERVEGGLWNLNNPVFNQVFRFFKRKEKVFLQEADHVISLTDNAKLEIESWKINNAPIAVIPTCVDMNLFDRKKVGENEKILLRKQLGILETDFVLLYLGSWGTWYLTGEMMDFFSRLKKAKTNAKFLIVTGDHIDLSNYSNKKDVVITYAERSKVPLHISVANAALCFIKPSFSKKASSATKMAEILAMKVPVISNAGWGDVSGYLHNKQNGIVLESFSEAQTSEAIRWILEIGTVESEELLKAHKLDKGIEEYGRIYKLLS